MAHIAAQRKQNQSLRLGFLSAFASGISLGLYFILAKYLTTTGHISPVIIPFFIAVSSTVILSLTPNTVTTVAKTNKQDLGLVSLMSLSAVVVGPILFTVGIMLSDASHSVLAGSSEMIFTILLSVFLFRERISRIASIGMCISVTGIIITSWVKNGSIAVAASFDYGSILLLSGALVFAFDNNIARKISENVSPTTVVWLKSAIGAAMLTPLAFVIGFASLTIQDLLLLFVAGALNTVLGFTLYLYAIRKIGVSKGMVIMESTIPVNLILASVLSDGEMVNFALLFVPSIVIVVGLLLIG